MDVQVVDSVYGAALYVTHYICVILHLPTIINHCDNSNVQQKEERLVSSTHLFILTKRLRLTITNTSLTITNTSLTINILIPVYLHENVTYVRMSHKHLSRSLLNS